MKVTKHQTTNPGLSKNACKQAIFCFLAVSYLSIIIKPQNCRPEDNMIGRDARYAETSSDDFALARSESMNFFDDVTSRSWIRKKNNARYESSQSREWVHLAHYPRWQHMDFNFQPVFSCDHERRIGRPGDGGKWICDPHRIEPEGCLVYSIGSNNDFSFEKEVQQQISHNCEIHTFDMGDYAEGAKLAGGNIAYHQTAFGNGQSIRGNPTKSLSTIIKELGHEHRVIDVFKIDCEGCEFDAVEDMLEANVTLRQIQIEIHGKQDPQLTSMFQIFKKHNYVMFHKEANRYSPLCYEFSFLKLAPAFFLENGNEVGAK